MVKKPFFGLVKPKLAYTGIDEIGKDIQEIPLPPKVILHCCLESAPSDADHLALSVGDDVRTGQKLMSFAAAGPYLTSSATGVITDVSIERGPFVRSIISVAVETKEADIWDPEFEKSGLTPDAETARAFLFDLPGIADISALIKKEAPLRTIMVTSLEQDLLIGTRQLSLTNGSQYLSEGIRCLQQITGAQKVIVAVPPGLSAKANQGGVDVAVVDAFYPQALPSLLTRRVLGPTALGTPGTPGSDVAVISVEAVIALGQAFSDGKTPVTKVLTVIDKENRAIGVRARIGTPAHHILSSLNIALGEGDRLVFGGPMTGRSVYSEEAPIKPDTDAIMVQDTEQVNPASSDPCINCGECVRVCPARLPVNMLIRLLENGLYEEAAQEYDLLSCVECGLCSYVCIMQIPVFHYIMLGKHELASSGYLEESNG